MANKKNVKSTKKTTSNSKKKEVKKVVKEVEEIEELEDEELDDEEEFEEIEEKEERPVKSSSEKNAPNYKAILIAVVCILLFACISFILPSGESNETTENETSQEYSVSDWSKDVKEKTVVTVLASTTCPHCQAYKPTITKLSKENNFVLYFFEIDSLSNDEQNVVTSTFELKNFEGAVPFTFIVKDGKVVSDTTGFSTEEETVKYLKSNGIIK